MSTTPATALSTNTTPATQAAPSGFGMMLSPATIEAAKDLAKTLANSGLVPNAYAGKPEMILIAGAMGHRLGLDIFSAMAGIAVINGRPTLWGDAMLAICQARTDWGGMNVQQDHKNGSCVVTITRKGHGTGYVGSFSMEEAARAGLADKAGPWKQYPQRMVELRARSYALRGAFADALAGFHCREEMEDVEPRDVEHTMLPNPAPAKERVAPTEQATATVSATSAHTVPEQQVIIPPTAPTAPDKPRVVTVAELGVFSAKLHKGFGTRALDVIRDICGKMGAGKVAEIKPDMAAEAMALFEKALVELTAPVQA